MSETQRFRVGFWVEVDVQASHESEAGLIANNAAGWPFCWHPGIGPVRVVGKLNGKTVEADIIVATPLMTKLAPSYDPDQD